MLTFPSRLKFKMSKNVKRRLGVIHIYNFNLFLLLPSVPMSQWARIVFKSLMESNQYLSLTACSPSLALISLQVSAGNSGIEPRGTNEQTQIAYFFMSVCEEMLQTKKWGKEVIKEEEETIKWQLYWYNYLVVCSGVVPVGVKKPFDLNHAQIVLFKGFLLYTIVIVFANELWKLSITSF